MPYDLFISYSRRNDERGQVAELKAQIESSFRAFAERDLRVALRRGNSNYSPNLITPKPIPSTDTQAMK